MSYAGFNKIDNNKKNKMIKDINESNNWIKKSRKLFLLKYLIIFIILFTIFKIFIGSINIQVPIDITDYEYQLLVNDSAIDLNVETIKKDPLIPFMLYFVSHSYSFPSGEHNYANLNESDSIILRINSYACYGKNSLKNQQVNCNEYTLESDKKYITDLNYKLIIKDNQNNEIYNGKYINDISNYVNKKGYYTLIITTKYKRSNTKMYGYIKVN